MEMNLHTEHYTNMQLDHNMLVIRNQHKNVWGKVIALENLNLSFWTFSYFSLMWFLHFSLKIFFELCCLHFGFRVLLLPEIRFTFLPIYLCHRWQRILHGRSDLTNCRWLVRCWEGVCGSIWAQREKLSCSTVPRMGWEGVATQSQPNSSHSTLTVSGLRDGLPMSLPQLNQLSSKHP